MSRRPGSLAVGYVRDMDRSGGFFLVRANAGLHPRVLHAVREDGQRLKSCQERDLKAMTAKFPTCQRAALEVQWRIDGQPFRWRLIVPWNPDTKSCDDLFTHLAQDSYSISIVCLGDTLRWQVALLFKDKFATEKETISEALIWASLAASSLKRFLAHAAERLLEVVISTRQAAMHSAYALPELFRALRDGDGPWYRRAFSNMRRYLGRNATRAHPKRDVRTGRAPLGLKSVFQLSES